VFHNRRQLYQMLTDFRNYCTVGKRIKFQQKDNISHLTLALVLHYLGKFKRLIYHKNRGKTWGGKYYMGFVRKFTFQ